MKPLAPSGWLPGRSLLAAALALALACAPGGPSPTEGTSALPGAARPMAEGLILVIVVDQMRADELDIPSGDGFGWLKSHGRVFSEAYLDHAHSETCPGHAVVLTGRQPGPAGITGNVFVLRTPRPASTRSRPRIAPPSCSAAGAPTAPGGWTGPTARASPPAATTGSACRAG
ncbi:MAG: alkaline phosphatase family protein [Deltaproteobacteria bacterium]|nr:alkaline phosphatase family protein [Deltaproteobacteria bacterium]